MARAVLRFVRMSPRKLRRVVNVIRGNDITSAQTTLKFMPYAAARVVEKVLRSAVSNAKENEHLDTGKLKVSRAYVDGATTLRRWRAMSRGRGYPILKRASHLTIEVEADKGLPLAGLSKKVEHAREQKRSEKHKQEEKQKLPREKNKLEASAKEQESKEKPKKQRKKRGDTQS